MAVAEVVSIFYWADVDYTSLQMASLHGFETDIHQKQTVFEWSDRLLYGHINLRKYKQIWKNKIKMWSLDSLRRNGNKVDGLSENGDTIIQKNNLMEERYSFNEYLQLLVSSFT